MTKTRVKDFLGKTVDLETAIARRLDGSDFGRGSLEIAAATAENCADLLAHIAAVLVDKGVISLVDLNMGFEDADR